MVIRHIMSVIITMMKAVFLISVMAVLREISPKKNFKCSGGKFFEPIAMILLSLELIILIASILGRKSFTIKNLGCSGAEGKSDSPGL